MMVYILTRYHRRYSIQELDIVSVHAKRADADKIAEEKNSKHEAVQPYIYRVVPKKLK